jgi:hypothetical protein
MFLVEAFAFDLARCMPAVYLVDINYIVFILYLVNILELASFNYEKIKPCSNDGLLSLQSSREEVILPAEFLLV